MAAHCPVVDLELRINIDMIETSKEEQCVILLRIDLLTFVQGENATENCVTNSRHVVLSTRR